MVIRLFNGSAWSAIKEYMSHRRGPRTFFCGCEHRLLEDKLEAQGKAMKAEGWYTAFAPASTAQNQQDLSDSRRSSAGTLVAAPGNVFLRLPAGAASWDASPPDQKGRLAHAWTPVLGGLHLLTAYFWCSQGWSGPNMAIMEQVAHIVRSIGGYWILAADFTLQNGYWTMATGGMVVAPSSKLGTCRQNTASGVTSDVYDYFLVDSRLQDRILGVDIDEDYPFISSQASSLDPKGKGACAVS